MEKNKEYTYSFFKSGYPEWKRKRDGLIIRYIFRPISFFVAGFAARNNISANQISFFSLLIATIGAVLYLPNSIVPHIIGALFIVFWLILDCTDGAIARSVKQQSYGDFADGISSYGLINFLFICLGVAAYQTDGLLIGKNTYWIIALGGAAGAFDSLARLIYQKFAATELKLQLDGKIKAEERSDANNQKGIQGLYRKVMRELGILGLFIPALILCTCMQWLDVFVIFYFAMYTLTLAGTLYSLIRKVLKINANE